MSRNACRERGSVVQRWTQRLAAMVVLGCAGSWAAAQAPSAKPEARIVAKVDEARRVTLAGNTHPLARRQFDHGVVSGSTPMQRMILVLRHSQAQDDALNALLTAQQDTKSPMFHRWLTPTEYGAQFGAADADLQAVTAWLGSKGFSIGSVAPGKNFVEFSGTAAQVQTAFQTEIHKYVVAGVSYQANAADPSIPEALAPVVRGVLSLHNFPRKPEHVLAGTFRRDNATGKLTRVAPAKRLEATPSAMGAAARPSPDFTYPDPTYNQTDYAVTPYDFATIYNLKPLWDAGIDGTGQTIAVLQETNIHLDDVRAFRSTFGLPANDPVVILNGPDPGITAYDEGEADIDVEWAGATAKGATILLVVSASTATTQGTDLSSLYAVENNIAPVTTLSYGECELGLGTAGNAFYNVLWQQGASQGMSHFVSTGDSGSAGCDDPDGTAAASYGLQVSGLASTPYNTAVGGTDFLGTALNPSTFWSSTNDATTKASALSYIPETTWNSDCTNPLFQTGFFGSLGTSSEAVCQNLASAGFTVPVGGSGGASGCINGDGSTLASCSQGYPKPSWQSGAGVPADSVRDIPDVSLFASNGFFGSFYSFCEEDEDADGQSCNANSPYSDILGVGGTSVSTPAFAGIMAMVNQKTNARNGLANYVLYNLFRKQVAAGTSCTSTYTNLSSAGGTPVLPAAGCVFNDLTYGSNSSACVKGSLNCVTATGYTYGILTATVNGVTSDGYTNTVGYDLASGLGSVNAANLVNSWASVTFVPTATTLGLSSTSFAHGTAVNATISVTPTTGTGTPTGNVELLTSTTPGSLGYVALTNGSVIGSYNNLPGGTYSVSAYYAGDGTYGSSSSAPVTVTVTPENSTLTGSIYLENESTGALTAGNAVAYGGEALISFMAAAASGNGFPTGKVTITNNAGLSSGPYTVNAIGQAGFDETTLPVGTYTFSGSYSGDASFNPSTSSASLSLTISKASTTTRTTKGTTGTVAAGVPVKLTSTIVGSNAASVGNFGAAPSGTVAFYESATRSAVTGGTFLGTAPISSASTSTSTGYTSGIASLEVVPPYSTTASSTEYFYTVYSGDGNYNTSSGALTTALTVSQGTKTATTTTLNLPTTSSTYGATSALSATVSTTGTGTPSGTVAFYVDGVSVGSAALSGTTASTTAALGGGAHAITAIYSGDATFLGSQGTGSLTVAPAATQVTITRSAAAATFGTPLTFVAQIPYTAAAVPTGTISFTVDGASVGVGIAALSLNTGSIGAIFESATLSPGSHTIAAVYSGDKNYATSNASTSVTIAAAPILTLTVNQRTAVVLGAPVKVNVQTTTTSGGPIPTGTITYSVDGGAGTTISLSNGVASFTLTGLSELMHVVSVTYNGNGTYSPVTQTLTLNTDVSQSILFPPLAPVTFATVQTVALAARTTSGELVTYAVTGPATLNTANATLTLTGTGTVNVTASAAANNSFAAATPVTRSFVVR